MGIGESGSSRVGGSVTRGGRVDLGVMGRKCDGVHCRKVSNNKNMLGKGETNPSCLQR